MRLVAGVLTISLYCAQLAAEPSAAVPGVEVSTVLGGLDGPISVAGRPTEGGAPIVVYQDATGVSRLLVDQSAQVVARMPEGCVAAPNCLLLIDSDSLIVGVNAREPGSETGPRLLVYELPEGTGTTVVAPSQSLAVPGSAADATPLALTENGRYLFVTTSDGVVARARFSSGGVGALAPLLMLDPPGARGAGISNQGFLTLAVAGERGADLAFRHPLDTSRAVALRVAAGLPEIGGLAYGLAPRPSDRLLYVLDPRGAAEGGGVYRIDANLRGGRMGCDAVRIAEIDRPTSLAFAGENVLYVTASGAGDRAGMLVRIEGEL